MRNTPLKDAIMRILPRVQTPAQYLAVSAFVGLGMSGVTILPNQVLVSRWFHERVGLVNGVVLAATRERYVAIARKMKEQQGIEALILGGTELPLLLRDAIDIGMTLLDTARLHVEAAVSELLSDEAR